ncbi:hypothetical protein [Geodermatophilus sabuli]|uniref:DUF3040 domain-containing protein n=1 Tax=Geodermatophilus sabuli TaxID=1564158 RepID=A0A285ECY9_9ACTN|nr:hypothetical protein [Geodermatophilus sabuli]MBB3083300.1 hypothetical protein [Geodermatophilus sabuli]SNX96979.1 hypothetical protein SAMN06893097_105320 [Geodermatophilus sabuli]
MLKDHEQQIWDDIARYYAEEVEEPVRRGGPPAWQRTGDLSGIDDMPAAAVAGLWSAIMLVLFGAVLAGVALGVVTALGWLLWHHWPRRARSGTQHDRDRPAAD